MFGYIVVDKPNILIKDFQTYRAYYCGLCKTIGKTSGQFMRFTLNYDIVLLALLGYNYENIDPKFLEEHCIAHPVGRKLSVVQQSPILERIADINTVLGYYKIVDDVADEGKHRAIKLALMPIFKKAKKRQPLLVQEVEKGYERLRDMEKNCINLETLSDCFGAILKNTADALTDKADKNLRELLYYLGKWIYIIDAFDDMKKDEKNGCFNPLLRKDKGLTDNVYEEIENAVRPIIYDCIDKITSCYDKMNINISEGALSNIIYLGLKYRAENVLTGRKNQCQKIRL